MTCQLSIAVVIVVWSPVRHNVPGGTVWISTAASNDLATLRIANTGLVVAAYEIPALFDPFRRLGTDRVGTARGAGLGLSIVRSVARAHGGYWTPRHAQRPTVADSR